MRRNRNVVQDLLPGWEDGTFQEGGLGRFRFLVLVIYVFLEKDGEMAAGMRRLDC